MIYLWEIPDNYPNRYIGRYDRTCSPDRFLLLEGRNLTEAVFNKLAVVRSKVATTQLTSRYDCICNSSMIPLVNERIRDILNEIAPKDVQFFPAKVICPDGELDGYEILNITHAIQGIDFEGSKYNKVVLQGGTVLYRFAHLVYKPGCMGSHHLVRDEEDKLLVSETIQKAFKAAKIKGVSIILPSEDVHPLAR